MPYFAEAILSREARVKILVTGGAGFIGSSLIRQLILQRNFSVVNVDKLTYAGNRESLGDVEESSLYFFEQIDICDSDEIHRVMMDHRPNLVMHLAAESHVDRSIDGPANFISTNILGTFNLLEAARYYFQSLEPAEKNEFRFHHISTDEVFGDLVGTDDLFSEQTCYSPSSPYSASKAASDHLVRAWGNF